MEEFIATPSGVVQLGLKVFICESCGLTVYSPGELSSLKPDVILVSSYWYAEEIGRELREEMGFKGEIFYFYGEATKGHPIARDY